MEFNGTIIITDPCYVAKDEDWGKRDMSRSFDYANNKVNIDVFTDYIWDNTGVGDGKWLISQLNDVKGSIELEDFVERIEDAYYNFFENTTVDNQVKLENLTNSKSIVGRFCVDSGSYGVFYLDEVLNYNPQFLTNYGDWCYTIIKDFIGDVSVYMDSRDHFHILGVGNKTFYSNTVSWL